MNEDLHKLGTVDIITRHVFHRSIDDGSAERELRRRGWQPTLANALESAFFAFVAFERFLAHVDDDHWDVPTTWREIAVSVAFSLLLSFPIVIFALGVLWFVGTAGWWLVFATLAWPASSLMLWGAVHKLQRNQDRDREQS